MPIKNILLVDDDEDDQLLFIDALKEIDPSIFCEIGNNGIEALSILRNAQNLPEIIFLDLNMPRMNGYDVLTEIKNDQNLNKIPIVIYTTSKSVVDQIRTQEMGAHYFFTKPTRLALIIEELRRILKSVEN